MKVLVVWGYTYPKVFEETQRIPAVQELERRHYAGGGADARFKGNDTIRNFIEGKIDNLRVGSLGLDLISVETK